MYTHSRCKFCRTLLDKVANPRNAFCTDVCKRMYRKHGTIRTFGGDADAIQKAVDSLGDKPTFGTTERERRNRKDSPTVPGTKQQPSLFDWVEQGPPDTNRGVRSPRKSKGKKSAVL